MWTIREASDQAAITTQLDNQAIQTNMQKQLCRSDPRSNCKMRLGNQREGCGTISDGSRAGLRYYHKVER